MKNIVLSFLERNIPGPVLPRSPEEDLIYLMYAIEIKKTQHNPKLGKS